MLSDLSLIHVVIKIGHHLILYFSGAEAVATANNMWSVPITFISPSHIPGRTHNWNEDWNIKQEQISASFSLTLT